MQTPYAGTAQDAVTNALGSLTATASNGALNISILQARLESLRTQIAGDNSTLLSLSTSDDRSTTLQNEILQLGAAADGLQGIVTKLQAGYTVTGYDTSTDVSTFVTTITVTFTKKSDGSTTTLKIVIPAPLTANAASANVSNAPDILSQLLQQLGAGLSGGQNPLANIQGKLNQMAALPNTPAGLTTPVDPCVAKGAKRPEPGSKQAVYDIAAGKVYMPDGSILEAHSGMGYMTDNPAYVNQINNGPTPPNVYNLSPRESPYYGVEALRLTPTDPGSMYGRDGILAHTKLVGGNNGSHGCVAFANYDAFLNAYKRGEVKQLIVVPRLTEDEKAKKACIPAAYDKKDGVAETPAEEKKP